MNVRLIAVLVTVPCLFVQCLFVGVAYADKTKKDARAKELVREALELEAKGGDAALRDGLLRDAVKESKEYAPGHWHQGEIFDRGQWFTMEKFAERSLSRDSLRDYERLRLETPDTEVGNLHLATWCKSRALGAQRYAHLRRVLELNSKNVAARVALGWQVTESGWISPEQIQADVRFAIEEKDSLENYGEKLQVILKRLTSSQERMIEVGKQELRELRDPRAVTAIEKIISAHSEPLATLGIESLSAIEHPSATRSLARHAIFHPSAKIRSLASSALIKRDPQGWAPGMIDLLRNQIDMGIMPEFGAGGTLMGMRQVFSQENRNSNDVFVADTAYQRYIATQITGAHSTSTLIDERPQNPNGRRTGVSSEGQTVLLYSAIDELNEMIAQNERINFAAAVSAQSAKYNVERRNKQSEMLNDRVFRALDKLDGKKIGTRPDDYWAWWNARKYWHSSTQKKNNFAYSASAVSDVRPEYAFVNHTGVTRIFNVSCLTADTLIWLQKGATPIRDVKVGDLVFCKDIATGEPKLAPVVGVTVSPEPFEILSFRAGDSESGYTDVECTRGHEFFIAGKGWMMACDMKVGDRLHTASGPQRIESVRTAGKAIVHNLVVANVSNYLVGKAKILSHDFSERAENYYLVPGLEPSKE